MFPTGRSTGSSNSAPLKSRPLLKPAFDVLDADGDGKISHKDLLESFHADDALVTQMISSADSNQDGVVEYHEFERVLGSSGATQQLVSVMEGVFNVMDTDGDGMVSFADLKSYLSSAGLMVSDDEVKAMIRLGGGDDDDDDKEGGGVSFEGLLAILAVDF